MSISIPPKFSELERLEAEDLRKIIRMATAVLKEKTPETQKETPQRKVRSSNVKDAFIAVPSDPVDAYQYADQHNISVSALRQQSRFDPLTDETDPLYQEDAERVHVKKKDGILYIWRGGKNALKDLV